MRVSVHPHACGEYRLMPHGWMNRSGSSPRVWGILIVGALGQHEQRFIPTRVGNTDFPISKHDPVSVHPHACGEYVPVLSVAKRQHGSSPRVWGIPHGPPSRAAYQRFIPTRVGNTRFFVPTA